MPAVAMNLSWKYDWEVLRATDRTSGIWSLLNSETNEIASTEYTEHDKTWEISLSLLQLLHYLQIYNMYSKSKMIESWEFIALHWCLFVKKQKSHKDIYTIWVKLIKDINTREKMKIAQNSINTNILYYIRKNSYLQYIHTRQKPSVYQWLYWFIHIVCLAVCKRENKFYGQYTKT